MTNTYVLSFPLLAATCILAANMFGYSRLVCDALIVLCLGVQAIISMRLFRDATHDTLTGLFNRGMGERRLKSLVRRAYNRHDPLAIIAMDIDHFKHINDTYGHAAGDVVLRQVAQLLHSTCRQSDVMRMGGEEFMILLPHANIRDATAIAERLRESLANHEINIGENRVVSVTASFGVSACDSFSDHQKNLEKAADRALYLAKNNGRNRVECEPLPQA
jgi:diguanylate cyclase (GGDEF)-like protein